MTRPLGSRNHWRRCDHEYPTPRDKAMHRAFLVHRCMAKFRLEEYDLTEREFFILWLPHWDGRGRGSTGMTMTRLDPEKAWSVDNCVFMTRHEHLSKLAELRRQTR